MVPTFVSAHTFYASRKAWFKHHARWVDIDTINNATNYTTKMKAKFPYCVQIKFNEPVPTPGQHQNNSISLITNSWRLQAEKLGAICPKLYCNQTVNMYFQMT